MEFTKRAPMPDLNHLSYKTYDNVYEPSDDSYLLMDAIHSESNFFLNHFQKQDPAVTCLEIGPGTAVATITLHNTLRAVDIHSHCIMVDVNPVAASIARETCLINKVSSFDVIRGDLVSSLRLLNNIDILVFNPPYVPTPSEEVGGDSISAAWAGGEKGREVLDRLLLEIDRLLSDRGVFYLIAVEENDVPELTTRLAKDGFMTTVLIEKRARNELLMVLKITRETSTKQTIPPTLFTTGTTLSTTKLSTTTSSTATSSTATSSTTTSFTATSEILSMPSLNVIETALSTHGFITIPNAFSNDLATQCIAEMTTLNLTPGEISSGGNNATSSARSDVRTFLNRNTSDRPPMLGCLAKQVDDLRISMCNTYNTDRSTVMVAKYNCGKDTGYVKHRDATDEKGGRKITVLCYLGEAGLEGGELNIYSNEDGEENTVVEKVTPTSGTIVIFRSHRLHSVSSVHKGTRYALTSWWTNKAALARELLLEERSKALRKLAFRRLQRQMKKN